MVTFLVARQTRQMCQTILMVLLAGFVLIAKAPVFGEEKPSEQGTSQVCRVLFLGDNTWHGGTLRRIFEAAGLARGHQVNITEIPAKGRPLGEVITALLEGGPEKGKWDFVVVFDHPVRILVQRDRDELVTEIRALQQLTPRIIWLLLPYQKFTRRGETERLEILARLGPHQGFDALPLVRLFQRTQQLAGSAPWARELSLDRPTSLSDYITACAIARVMWGTSEQLPNDIRISDAASLHIAEEALPLIAKVLSGPEVAQVSGVSVTGDFVPELSSPQQFLSDGMALTMSSAPIPGFLDWNGDGGLELALSERVIGQFQIWRWQGPNHILSLTQEARFPAGRLSPNLASLLKAGATVFQIVDFDHNRYPDLLIGTSDKKICLCRGQPGMVFGVPETFQLEDGTPFEVPYLYRAFIGELTKDGVWDLVVGDEGGQVFLASLMEKEGRLAWSRLRPISVGGLILQLEGGASPIFADWDLDGLSDLVVGSRYGSVIWMRNVGSGEQPDWAPPISLVWPCREESTALVPYRNDVELWTPTPGWSAQPAVADVNGDHLPDLILGDSNCRVVKYRDLSAEERQEIDVLLKKRAELLQKVNQASPETVTAAKAMLWEVTLELIQKSGDKRYERCGWLWYFQRKAIATPDE